MAALEDAALKKSIFISNSVERAMALALLGRLGGIVSLQ
jgi:hypothetical protein